MFALYVRSSVALFGLTATPLLSQTIVSGVVRAERGRPLAGAAVQVKGTHGGATTSETGQYRLVVPNDGFATVDSLTVIARAIGYEPMSQRVAARPGSFTVDFGLKATTLRLEAVVVTGAVGASDAVSSRGGKDRRESSGRSRVGGKWRASGPEPGYSDRGGLERRRALAAVLALSRPFSRECMEPLGTRSRPAASPACSRGRATALDAPSAGPWVPGRRDRLDG
jgi:carboxypeptidase-like protein